MNDVVQKLMEEFNSKIGELKVIYETLSNIKIITKAEFELPDINMITDGARGAEAKAKPELSIRCDTFVNKSNTEAAEAYLKMVGHAVSLDEIYNALVSGGITFTGNGKSTLYSQIIRATRKFIKIGQGSNVNFGLLEFYPKKKRKAGESSDKSDEIIDESVEEPEESEDQGLEEQEEPI